MSSTKKFQALFLAAVACCAATLLPSATATAAVDGSGGIGSDCSILGPNPACAAQLLNYSSRFSGSNYVWTLTTNTAGAAFCGPTDQQSVCITAAQAGQFRLQLDYVLNNIPRTCAAEVQVHDAIEILALESQDACEGDTVVFATAVLSGGGPFTFSWTFDDGSGPVVIPGADSTSLTLTGVSIGDSGTYCVEVSGECGTGSSCADLNVTNCEGDGFCTFTQGFWGNAGGKFNGMNKAQLYAIVLSTDLVIGKPGRSLTIPAGAASGDCIIARLPGVSTAGTLPSFGDAILDTNQCQTSPTQIPLKNGKFKNVFLGQMISLSLNTRLDANLSGASLCANMTSQLLSPGPDGLLGTDDDVDNPGDDGVFGTADDQRSISIPQSVLSALTALGLPQTVGGLLELANRGIAGQNTAGASIPSLNDAVDGINNLFDGCRRLIGCS